MINIIIKKLLLITICTKMYCVRDENVSVRIVGADGTEYCDAYGKPVSVILSETEIFRMTPLGKAVKNPVELTLKSQSKTCEIKPVLMGIIMSYFSTKIIPASPIHKKLVELIKEQTGLDFNSERQFPDDFLSIFIDIHYSFTITEYINPMICVSKRIIERQNIYTLLPPL